MSDARPRLPPFTRATAIQKVRMAEDGWNSRDSDRVSLAYSTDSYWRNRAEFIQGRPAIVEFLARKWARELDYRLIKELWAFTDDRVAVRFAYEWHDDAGNWFRSYGNENWEFGEDGLMRRRLTACSGHAAKQLSHSKQLPQDRHRPASVLASSRLRPFTTSAKELRAASGSSGWACRIDSRNTGRSNISKRTSGCLGGRS
jgi:uncharacterized protein